MVLCTVGHDKFPLAFPFKKSTCPRQALIELIAPPQFTLTLRVLEIANLCLLYSQWITSTPTTCLHEDVCVWCQSRPAWNRQTDRPVWADHVENPWLVDRCISTNDIITTTIFTEQFGYDRKEKGQASTSLPEPQSDASTSTNVIH